MSLYALFLLENILLAAHQGKTAKPENKVSLNNIRMICTQLEIAFILLLRRAPYAGDHTRSQWSVL